MRPPLNRRTCPSCGLEKERYGQWRYCWDCHRAQIDLRERAHQAVSKEVASGRLPATRDCRCVDCGGQAAEYDHRDYTKPLDVVPVCRRCNQARGPAIQLTRFAQVGADI